MAYTSPATVNLTSSDGMGNLLIYLNEVTNYWISNLLVLTIFIIFFMGYTRVNKDDFKGAFAVSSYVTFALSTILWLIGFVTNITFGLTLMLASISTVILFLDSNRN